MTAQQMIAAKVSEVEQLAADYWEFRLHEFPVDATAAGDRRFDDRLEGCTPEDFERRARWCQATLSHLDGIAADALAPDEQVSLGLLREQMQMIVLAYELDDHLIPKLFPFGFAYLLEALATSTLLRSQTEAEMFIERLAAVPRYIDESIELLRLGAAKGYLIPKTLLAPVTGLVDAWLAKDGVGARLERCFAAWPALVADGDKAIEGAAITALARYRTFLAEEAPDMTRETVGLCDQPGGAAYYAFKIAQQTGTDLGAEEIHRLGLDEVARIRSEIDAIASKLGYPGAAPELARKLETDPSMIEPDAETLLARTRALAKRIDGTLPSLFGCLPRSAYSVEQLGFAASAQLPPALAQPSPADRSMPGIFWLTALPEKLPRHFLIPLTLHEAWPGHLMQFGRAHELDTLPAFRRYGWTDYNAYVEGWALYCERLGHDLGLYETDEDEFGRLTFELWRACRLVVDTGIHAMGWNRANAVAWFTENSFLTADVIQSEVDRYIGMPAQALSYKIGEIAIRRLRAEAEAVLGDAFILRDFHDEILALGPVSLSSLDQHMATWIKLNSP